MTQRPGRRLLVVEEALKNQAAHFYEYVKSVAELNARAGGETVAAAALVDRSNGTADLGVPFFPLIRLDVPTYAADSLPPELAAIPAIKPGSRAA